MIRVHLKEGGTSTSGNRGHQGVPGVRGGSAPGSGSGQVQSTPINPTADGKIEHPKPTIYNGGVPIDSRVGDANKNLLGSAKAVSELGIASTKNALNQLERLMAGTIPTSSQDMINQLSSISKAIKTANLSSKNPNTLNAIQKLVTNLRITKRYLQKEINRTGPKQMSLAQMQGRTVGKDVGRL